ncbi:unnamed protein product [Pleuronectes platessa]|uniref:Kinesin-like protein KIF2A-like N-terminal domain-containing protein n=1 Tax=Pleuronectes platessa TaxID=8262 RepID=A0A9N7ZAH1_PLEPL|nr:unnamed protein product [Pleuronectes platessa]
MKLVSLTISMLSRFESWAAFAFIPEAAKMETSLSRLLVGLSVQISRSDGRVHLATVKSVEAAKSTVMVEWYERKICRGKEVEVSELCELNPEISDHVNTVTNKAADPPALAPEKKYEGRLRSSRIPAPPSFASRSQVRQTCMFQVPVPGCSTSPNHSGLSGDPGDGRTRSPHVICSNKFCDFPSAA